MAKVNSTKTVEVGSAFDLLPKSLEIVKNNWPAFLVVNILTLVSSLPFLQPEPTEFNVQNNEAAFSSENIAGLSGFGLGTLLGFVGVVALLFAAVNFFLLVMYFVLQVKSSAGKKPGIGELFNEAVKNWLWLRYIGLVLLGGLILVVGFLLLIVPGIIAYGRLAMSPYLLYDKNLGVIDAIKQSNELGKSFTGKVWGAIGVTFLVAIGAAILGIIPLVGSLLGSALVIVYSLVLPLRYQQLKNLDVVTVEK